MTRRTSANQQISVLIHKLTYLMDRMAEGILHAGVDLTFAHYRLLMALLTSGGISQGQLAKYFGLTDGAVSRKMSDLAKRGLIARSVKRGNRREYVLTITARGKRITLEASALLDRESEHFFKILHKQEKALLKRSLKLLLDALCRFQENRRPTISHTHHVYH